MYPVSQTRLLRLQMLVKKHNGSLADLNEAIGFVRTDATLSQIRTKAPHSKTGKPRVMGDDLARKIEERLSLKPGWMDTPPSYAELADTNDTMRELWVVMESMNTRDLSQAKAVLLALKSSSNADVSIPSESTNEEANVESSGSIKKPARYRLKKKAPNYSDAREYVVVRKPKKPQSEAERLRLLRKELREQSNRPRWFDPSKIIVK